ncbi:TRAP transporter small permease [Roseobacter sp. GAI101]|uniref:TRAP transporter small permease n=1 Tax=Roseobacter sp. (strain GAI101) TaxID=391589 RepID=UPI0001871F0C|nr:TRAP transporter small permease [Roseobacter sp. GAI101]EEB82398.1 TRAP transporter, DctQ-like membrane protein [Roseobacter sp. GAI101]
MLRTLDRFVGAIFGLLGLVLIAMVGLSVWNAFSRYVLGNALLWADEVATFGMIYIAYLGAVACVWRGADIRMDILLNMLPAPLQRILKIIQQIVICGLCIWVGWLSWVYVSRIAQVGMKSTGAKIPLWAIHGTLTLGFALFAAIALLRLIHLILRGNESLSPSALAAEVIPE